MNIQKNFRKDLLSKDKLQKALVILILSIISILTIDVFTTENDGRRQIIDDNGATEVALTTILSDIKGAGEVDVMIRYDDKNEITGVILTSTGAGNSVVKRDLTNAVAAVFDIPVSNVMVFEKEDKGDNRNEQ